VVSKSPFHQSISDVIAWSLKSPYDIHGRKGEVLFFCSFLHKTQSINRKMSWKPSLLLKFKL
jgi:hypothetical protein